MKREDAQNLVAELKGVCTRYAKSKGVGSETFSYHYYNLMLTCLLVDYPEIATEIKARINNFEKAGG